MSLVVVVEEGDILEVVVGAIAVVTEIVTAAEMEATSHHEAMEEVGIAVMAAETATVVVAVEGTAIAEGAGIVIVAGTAMEEVEEIVMEGETAIAAVVEEAVVMAEDTVEGTAVVEEGDGTAMEVVVEIAMVAAITEKEGHTEIAAEAHLLGEVAG